MIGYKAAFTEYDSCCRPVRPVILVLDIPDDAFVVTTHNKHGKRVYRTNKARVSNIYDMHFAEYREKEYSDHPVAVSWYDRSFIYELGKEVSVTIFDASPWKDCTAGIHFYDNITHAQMFGRAYESTIPYQVPIFLVEDGVLFYKEKDGDYKPVLETISDRTRY